MIEATSGARGPGWSGTDELLYFKYRGDFSSEYVVALLRHQQTMPCGNPTLQSTLRVVFSVWLVVVDSSVL